MLTVSCPSCGAEVVFRTAALPTRVCAYCRTMLVRAGDSVAPVGTAAELPFDVSPVQLGMRGTAGETGFEVIGRMRWAWTDGSWNEWLLLLDDGRHAWLGDAMGQFMLLFERPTDEVSWPLLQTIAGGGEAIPGASAQLDGERLVVADARDVWSTACEGELPFRAPQGWRMYSVDLRAASGRAVSIQRDADGTSLYDGVYLTLADLAPRGLRRFEGWAAPAYAG
jgi:hypothetical protein